MAATTTAPLHLTPEDYHIIRAEDFGSAGLTARESVGPAVDVQAFGPLVTIHDSTFEPHTGIGHHPHQRMERLFYILEGAVDHDDALNHITGHMGLGDLGILTEGRRGMLHSEWNNTDGRTRCYILVYPTEPLPETAAFDAIRDTEAVRSQPAPGVASKHVVERGEKRLHGDIREFADTTLAQDASIDVRLGVDECGVVFVIEGGVEIADGPSGVAPEHTVLLPPAASERVVRVQATRDSRILTCVMGPGLGLRRRDG